MHAHFYEDWRHSREVPEISGLYSLNGAYAQHFKVQRKMLKIELINKMNLLDMNFLNFICWHSDLYIARICNST
jgi:hypothetical protein